MEGLPVMPPFKHERHRQTIYRQKRFRAKWVPVRVKKTRQNKI